MFVVNDSGASRIIKLTLMLKSASRKGIPERPLKTFIDVVLTVPPNGESENFGPFNITFDKDKFDDGTYVLEAEIVLLEGDVLDDKFGKGVVLRT